ncbi:MAG: FMN-binding protein [Acidimicrobiales bacterium]
MSESHDTNRNAADLDAAVAARLERLNARRATSDPRSAARQPTRPPSAAAPSTSQAGPPPKRKRRHAAAGARQAALALSLVTTGGLTYAMSMSPAADASVAAGAAGVVSATPSPVTAAPSTSADAAAAGTAEAAVPAAPSTTQTPTTSTPPATTPIVVNGAAYSNRWGIVQVQATFDPDGTLTSVTTLQTPDGDRKSVSINNRAVPKLNSEALSVQSANVDTVSGATYTSNDYRRSLQSAIDAVQASGMLTA